MTRLLAALLLAALCAALATAAPDKPPDVPWCVGSDPSYCNPVDGREVAPIPPDLPPEAKLRAQLLKERKQHAQQVRVLRQEIRRLEEAL